MKKVFIIHGWDGYPDEGWFPWLKSELEKRGFEVFLPVMPNSSEPKINEWVLYLKKLVGMPNEEIFFVGHSIGCQTIMRYLETLPKNAKVGGVVFVAGWITLKGLKTKEEREIAKPWLEKPINYTKVKEGSKSFIAIMSDNDPFVPLSDSRTFKEKLNAEIIIEKNKGHFSGSDNVNELPIVLNSFLRISKND